MSVRLPTTVSHRRLRDIFPLILANVADVGKIVCKGFDFDLGGILPLV